MHVETQFMRRAFETTMLNMRHTLPSLALIGLLGCSEASVAGSGGTVSVIHPAESIAEHVRVVNGERVDGRGTVPAEDLRRSVRAFVGSGVEQCYDAYLDRVGATRGEIEFTFAAVDGQIREVRVERASFDTAMRTCVTRAVQGMSLAHTTGRSVFSYVLQVGD